MARKRTRFLGEVAASAVSVTVRALRRRAASTAGQMFLRRLQYVGVSSALRTHRSRHGPHPLPVRPPQTATGARKDSGSCPLPSSPSDSRQIQLHPNLTSGRRLSGVRIGPILLF